MNTILHCNDGSIYVERKILLHEPYFDGLYNINPHKKDIHIEYPTYIILSYIKILKQYDNWYSLLKTKKDIEIIFDFMMYSCSNLCERFLLICLKEYNNVSFVINYKTDLHDFMIYIYMYSMIKDLNIQRQMDEDINMLLSKYSTKILLYFDTMTHIGRTSYNILQLDIWYNLIIYANEITNVCIFQFIKHVYEYLMNIDMCDNNILLYCGYCITNYEKCEETTILLKMISKIGQYIYQNK